MWPSTSGLLSETWLSPQDSSLQFESSPFISTVSVVLNSAFTPALSSQTWVVLRELRLESESSWHVVDEPTPQPLHIILCTHSSFTSVSQVGPLCFVLSTCRVLCSSVFCQITHSLSKPRLLGSHSGDLPRLSRSGLLGTAYDIVSAEAPGDVLLCSLR